MVAHHVEADETRCFEDVAPDALGAWIGERLFAISPGAVDLQGRPQAVLDLTVALTYVTSSGAPGSLAAFADLDKVLLYQDA